MAGWIASKSDWNPTRSVTVDDLTSPTCEIRPTIAIQRDSDMIHSRCFPIQPNLRQIYFFFLLFLFSFFYYYQRRLFADRLK